MKKSIVALGALALIVMAAPAEARMRGGMLIGAQRGLDLAVAVSGLELEFAR
jgi:hypothetical protein